MKRLFEIGKTLLIAALLIACGKTAANSPSTQSDILQDTEWQLAALNATTPIEESTITLRFGAGTIQGSGGCNTYNGNYAVSENSLAFSGVYWTEMGCMEPEAILEQEQAYFALLKRVVQYQMTDGMLVLLDEAGNQILEYETFDAGNQNQASEPMETPVTVVPSDTEGVDEPVTETEEEATTSPLADHATVNINVPEDYQPVVDPASKVAIWVPDTWSYTLLSRGNTIILQSHPPDKYIGGEEHEPGDTKCDFTVHPQGTETEDIMPRDQKDPEVTVVSTEEITLLSGQKAQRFEVESMGRAYVVVTMICDRVVTLACFGNPEPFDTIASTLSGMPEIPLSVDLTPESTAIAGGIVNIEFAIANASSEGLYLLTWFTPLEGLSGDIIKIQHEGSIIDYQGKLVKRSDPKPEDYVLLEAGESLTVTVNLAEGYDLSKPGEYTVRFRSPRISYIASSPEEQVYSVDDLGMVWIPSGPILVTISEP